MILTQMVDPAPAPARTTSGNRCAEPMERPTRHCAISATKPACLTRPMSRWPTWENARLMVGSSKFYGDFPIGRRSNRPKMHKPKVPIDRRSYRPMVRKTEGPTDRLEGRGYSDA